MDHPREGQRLLDRRDRLGAGAPLEAPVRGRRPGALSGLLTGLAALLLLSCGGEADAASAELPAAFLADRLAEATAAVEEARATAAADSDARAASLEEAVIRLRQLREYYLPLLDARRRVAEASRTAATDPGTAGAALDAAEGVLLGIVRTHGRHLEGEMRKPLERIEDARVALEAGEAGEAARVLERLDDHLESIFFRGALVLEGSELDPTPGVDGR